MEKHEKMLKINKEQSKKKEEKAIRTIRKMLTDNEQITVGVLVEKTGLSRAFFYNNMEVNAELEQAKAKQAGKSFVTKQKVIIDRAVEERISFLERLVAKKDSEILSLKKENDKLKKTLQARTLKIIEEL